MQLFLNTYLKCKLNNLYCLHFSKPPSTFLFYAPCSYFL